MKKRRRDRTVQLDSHVQIVNQILSYYCHALRANFEKSPKFVKILTLEHHQFASRAELAIYTKKVRLLIQVKSKQSVNIIVSDRAHFYIEKVV